VIPANASYTTAGGTAAFVLVASDQQCGWKAEQRRPERTGRVSRARCVGRDDCRRLRRAIECRTAQPPLPRQAEVRVTNSADAPAGSYAYSQQ